MKMISPSLVLEATSEIFSKVINDNKLLEGETEIVDVMLKKLNMQLKKPEEVIIRQGAED